MTTTSPPQAPGIDPLPVPPLPSRGFSRRQVLKGAGVGGAVVVVAGIGAGSYRVFDSAVLDPGSRRAYDRWQRWRDIPGPLGAVAAAVLAANPHNTQPWVFHVTDRAIEVYVDAVRNIGTVDPYRREQHVGLGCALENLALACRARGLQPTIGLLPDGPSGSRVAHVALTPAGRRGSPLYDAIGRRRTNRGPYSRRPVAADILTALVDTGGPPG